MQRLPDHLVDDAAPRAHWHNKVPEITIFFWVVKVLCTTVGESAADYINETLGFGLGPTTALMTVVLVVVLALQFRTRVYTPWVYWLTVVLVSVVGTLATDNLTDGLGVSLLVTTPVFAVLLAAVFAAWYRSEGTLSIHSIVTPRREAFYWLVVLVTFALGTAAGDLLVDRLSMSLLAAVAVYAAALALVFVVWRTRLVGPLTTFWVGYVLTRPLGGSTGDYLSGDKADGGAGLGTAVTTSAFLLCILATVAYLSASGRDRTPDPTIAG
ncbi:putative membrane-anchored protein [Motilibacter peucedani]|uniref:Putative membrane-anchored protein n=1 Tax=Motilibacter peucedani TaxID=598650 RepID=A0A420XTJ5_9ACTN|nr:hypothetical protein [Motilibacter peucedani]RKS80061.1 putative membrane-anchored protein [Motilibacter peucedani]